MAITIGLAWRLRSDSGGENIGPRMFADIVACRRADFESDVVLPNTLAFEAGREGRLILAR